MDATGVKSEFEQALESELNAIAEQQLLLGDRHEAIQRLLDMYNAEQNPRMAATGYKLHPRQTGAAVTKTKQCKPVSVADKPSSLEMARRVLLNAGGRTMSIHMIREGIRKLYGVDPAVSLDQMISKRAKASKGFYRADNGEYGTSELQPELTVLNLSTSTVIA